MESKAIVRYVRITPRKVRLVSDLVRGKKVTDALNILKFSARRRTASALSCLIESAVANAEHKGRVDVDNFLQLVVTNRRRRTSTNQVKTQYARNNDGDCESDSIAAHSEFSFSNECETD